MARFDHRQQLRSLRRHAFLLPVRKGSMPFQRPHHTLEPARPDIPVGLSYCTLGRNLGVAVLIGLPLGRVVPSPGWPRCSHHRGARSRVSASGGRGRPGGEGAGGVDTGYEGLSLILEPKMGSADFHLRQLYYPFRLEPVDAQAGRPSSLPSRLRTEDRLRSMSSILPMSTVSAAGRAAAYRLALARAVCPSAVHSHSQRASPRPI